MDRNHQVWLKIKIKLIQNNTMEDKAEYKVQKKSQHFDDKTAIELVEVFNKLSEYQLNIMLRALDLRRNQNG